MLEVIPVGVGISLYVKEGRCNDHLYLGTTPSGFSFRSELDHRRLGNAKLACWHFPMPGPRKPDAMPWQYPRDQSRSEIMCSIFLKPALISC